MPELLVNYSPNLNLAVRCLQSIQYGYAHGERLCEVCCRLRHPTGYFEYCAQDLHFEANAFENFAGDLLGIQSGQHFAAHLSAPGDMFSLRLQLQGRELLLSLNIREHIPPRIATLNATIDVDYDLFVNKLLSECRIFVKELTAMEVKKL